MKECKINDNLKFCPCSYPTCSRKGICCECLKYHRDHGELPACYFSPKVEKTYDRTIENFIRNYKSKINY